MVIRFCRALILIVGLFLIHLIFINLLPSPFNNINLIFLYLLWQIIHYNKLPVWQSLVLAGLLELFSSTPFGINLIIYPASFTLLFWISKNILVNRSFYTIIITTALGVVLFRLIFIIALLILNVFIASLFTLNQEILIYIGWEIVLNCAFSVIIYLVTLSSFLKNNKWF